jgi:hypothetical protein
MPDERRLREQAREAIERGKTSLSSRFGSPTTATAAWEFERSKPV